MQRAQIDHLIRGSRVVWDPAQTSKKATNPHYASTFGSWGNTVTLINLMTLTVPGCCSQHHMGLGGAQTWEPPDSLPSLETYTYTARTPIRGSGQFNEDLGKARKG